MKKLLSFFWFIAIAIFTVISLEIITLIQAGSINRVIEWLVPFGILISALLASTSVLYSIENTNQLALENMEKENERAAELQKQKDLENQESEAKEKEKSLRLLAFLLDSFLNDVEIMKEALFLKNRDKGLAFFIEIFGNKTEAFDNKVPCLLDKNIIAHLDQDQEFTLNAIINHLYVVIKYKKKILLIDNATFEGDDFQKELDKMKKELEDTTKAIKSLQTTMSSLEIS